LRSAHGSSDVSRLAIKRPGSCHHRAAAGGLRRSLVVIHRDGVRLLYRTTCGSVCDIRSREFERPPTVVAAAGVELCSVVREGEQVSAKKFFEARPCGVELRLCLFEPLLRD
jgi:hypothetical protein